MIKPLQILIVLLLVTAWGIFLIWDCKPTPCPPCKECQSVPVSELDIPIKTEIDPQDESLAKFDKQSLRIYQDGKSVGSIHLYVADDSLRWDLGNSVNATFNGTPTNLATHFSYPSIVQDIKAADALILIGTASEESPNDPRWQRELALARFTKLKDIFRQHPPNPFAHWYSLLLYRHNVTGKSVLETAHQRAIIIATLVIDRPDPKNAETTPLDLWAINPSILESIVKNRLRTFLLPTKLENYKGQEFDLAR